LLVNWRPTAAALGTPAGSRAWGPFRQAVLVLRWFRERGCVHCLARDAWVSQVTGCRYLYEGIDMLADQAPDLHEALARCRREGMAHVVLDGTLLRSDRVAGVCENGNDWWFSQKQWAAVQRKWILLGRSAGTMWAGRGHARFLPGGQLTQVPSAPPIRKALAPESARAAPS